MKFKIQLNTVVIKKEQKLSFYQMYIYIYIYKLIDVIFILNRVMKNNRFKLNFTL